MDEDLDILLERYEAIRKEMQLTLEAIEQSKTDSLRIAEIHQFLERFDSVEAFIGHIKNLESRLFYLKDALTTQEAAQYLGMKVSTLYKKTMHNELPFYSPSGKRLYFKRQELEDWMLQNRQASLEERQAEATLSGLTNLYVGKRNKGLNKKKEKPQ